MTIPPSRWVNSSSSCKRGLGKDGQSICSTTRRRYYSVSTLPPDIHQRTRDPCRATQPSIYEQPIEAQLRVNISCILLFQMGGYLECIRFCIYDSVAGLKSHRESIPLFLSLPALSFKPNPLSLCNQPSYRFRPPGTFSYMTLLVINVWSILCICNSVWLFRYLDK